MRSQYLRQSTKAFTLIEIVVVTTVVTVAFFSIIALVYRAINLYYNNKNVLISNTIAQQGVELARYVRDNNWMTPIAYQEDENSFVYQLSRTTEPAQNGDIAIIAIDPRYALYPLVKNVKLAPVLWSSWDTANSLCASDISYDRNTTLEAVIKACLNHDKAQLHYDTVDKLGNVMIHDLADFPKNSTARSSGFSRLLVTEYRDGGVTDDTKDDYLHVESWVRWQDHGRDKYFHLDQDLYDYSWRYEKE